MSGQAGTRDNFSGDISIAAPTGGVTVGKAYLIGAAYMVARETQSATALTLFAKRGPVWVSTTASTTLAVGAKVYLVTSTHVVGSAVTGNVLVGYALSACASDATVLVDWMECGAAAT